MIAVDLHLQCSLHHQQDLLRVAEENRRARQARPPRPLRPRVGHALIAAGQMLIGQPAYAAYDEALAIVNRCESEYRQDAAGELAAHLRERSARTPCEPDSTPGYDPKENSPAASRQAPHPASTRQPLAARPVRIDFSVRTGARGRATRLARTSSRVDSLPSWSTGAPRPPSALFCSCARLGRRAPPEREHYGTQGPVRSARSASACSRSERSAPCSSRTIRAAVSESVRAWAMAGVSQPGVLSRLVE